MQRVFTSVHKDEFCLVVSSLLIIIHEYSAEGTLEAMEGQFYFEIESTSIRGTTSEDLSKRIQISPALPTRCRRTSDPLRSQVLGSLDVLHLPLHGLDFLEDGGLDRLSSFDMSGSQGQLGTGGQLVSP